MVSLSILMIVSLVGCTCLDTAPPIQPAKVQAAPKPAPKPAPAPAAKPGVCGDYSISQNYMQSGAVETAKGNASDSST